MVKKNNIALPSEASDSDDFDVTYESLECGLRARIIRKTRASLGVTQTEFAKRFKVPVGTLRDWEQARVTPPEYAVAYAKIIAADPNYVDRIIA